MFLESERERERDRDGGRKRLRVCMSTISLLHTTGHPLLADLTNPLDRTQNIPFPPPPSPRLSLSSLQHAATARTHCKQILVLQISGSSENELQYKIIAQKAAFHSHKLCQDLNQ